MKFKLFVFQYCLWIEATIAMWQLTAFGQMVSMHDL